VSLHVIRGWRDVAPEDRGASVAFGAFDGVHRGHQVVIAAAAEAGRRLGAPLGVISFDPHPGRWFKPDAAPFMLATPRQTRAALKALGVQRLYYLPFDASVARMSAEAFARDILVEGWGVRHVAVGFDFLFGRGREGNAQTLEALGARYGFGVTVVAAVNDPTGEKLSSTAVRAAVGQGDMGAAAAILGRPFAIEGEVVRGEGLGAGLGFPTANVALGDYVQPRLGVYATRTRLSDGRVVDGVASVGTNPTTGLVAPRLEVWLFDFDEDLYGQVIETELVEFIRPEERFASLEALKAQVADDAARARAILAAHGRAGS
jgi:riboflavin kinase/FMN adenylyltransferase